LSRDDESLRLWFCFDFFGYLPLLVYLPFLRCLTLSSSDELLYFFRFEACFLTVFFIRGLKLSSDKLLPDESCFFFLVALVRFLDSSLTELRCFDKVGLRETNRAGLRFLVDDEEESLSDENDDESDCEEDDGALDYS